MLKEHLHKIKRTVEAPRSNVNSRNAKMTKGTVLLCSLEIRAVAKSYLIDKTYLNISLDCSFFWI